MPPMRVAVPADEGVRLRPLLRREYDQLVEAGAFDDAAVELLEGALVEVSPEGPRHRSVINMLAEHLIRSLPRDLLVQVAGPWAASDRSEPEPDIAVVPRERYDRDHPGKALLLVEVSASSLRTDLTIKAGIYGEAGVPVYWVVDLVHDVILVHREPAADGYRLIERCSFDDTLDAAGTPVRLRDLLEG